MASKSFSIKMDNYSKEVINRLTTEWSKWTSGKLQGSKLGDFCELLAKIGIGEAKRLYASAVSSVSHTADEMSMPNVTDARWVADNVLQFSAEGKDVLFLEFGTGLVGYENSARTENYPSDSKFDVVFSPGSWSAQDKQYLVDEKKLEHFKGAWPVGNEHHLAYGTNPAKGMYEAEKFMREQIGTAAKQVFGTK